MNIIKLIIRIIWICISGITLPVIYLVLLPIMWAICDEPFFDVYEDVNDIVATMWGFKQ